MLAIVILIDKPNVMIKTPRFKMIGLSKPNDCQKLSQLNPGIFCVSVATKLPKTIPASIKSNNTQTFLDPAFLICTPPLFILTNFTYFITI